MKIIQVNAWLGHLMGPLGKFIEQENPDIVCSQEIFDCATPNGLFDFVQINDALVAAGSFKHVFFAPTYSLELMGEKVQMGNAIYSKLPLENRQTTFINGSYEENQQMSQFKRNIRNLQVCEVMIQGKKISIANLQGFHDLNPLGTEQTIACMENVAKTLQAYADSLIFCGDFNINLQSPAHKPLASLGLSNLTTQLNAVSTLSNVHKAAPINVVADYILVSKNIRVNSFVISEALVSDHKALILDFDI